MESHDDRLDDPTGGPSAGSAASPEETAGAPIDPSAGAGGQERGEGAVQDATEDTGAVKPNPG